MLFSKKWKMRTRIWLRSCKKSRRRTGIRLKILTIIEECEKLIKDKEKIFKTGN